MPRKTLYQDGDRDSIDVIAKSERHGVTYDIIYMSFG